MQNLSAILYEDGGLIASSRLDRFQEALDVLTGLFEQVGLGKNFNKMVDMVYQPCCTSVSQSEITYTRRMKGDGPSYRARKR